MKIRTLFTAGIALLVSAGVMAGCSADKSTDISSAGETSGTTYKEAEPSEYPGALLF